MHSVNIAYAGTDLDFQRAWALARQAAREQNMADPAIMAWHRHSTHAMSPQYDGANPDSWWEKYGFGNGGRMGVTVGDEFDFVLMDTRGFETVDRPPIRNITGQDGQEYICLAPMLGDGGLPNASACVPLDDWMADQY